MAITHATTTRNLLAQAIADATDAGSAEGTVEFQTAGNAEVATATMADPAFSSPSSGTITANTVAGDPSATGGVVTQFVVKDSDGNAVFSGSVTAVGGGGDCQLNTVTVTASDTVDIASFTYTAPN